MYQGHHQDGSSIQKHSTGSHYPYVVVITSRNAYVMGPDGEPAGGTRYWHWDAPAYRQEAYAAAITLAERLARGET